MDAIDVLLILARMAEGDTPGRRCSVIGGKGPRAV